MDNETRHRRMIAAGGMQALGLALGVGGAWMLSATLGVFALAAALFAAGWALERASH